MQFITSDALSRVTGVPRGTLRLMRNTTIGGRTLPVRRPRSTDGLPGSACYEVTAVVRWLSAVWVNWTDEHAALIRAAALPQAEAD